MTLLEGIVGTIALTLVIGVFVLARLAVRLGRAADQVAFTTRRVGELVPAARGLIESGHSQLESLRSLTHSATDVADDVRAVTGRASAVTSQVLRGFESVVANRYLAVFAGARAGFDALQRFRGGNGSRTLASVEEEESTR
jgi:hypothetical protein